MGAFWVRKHILFELKKYRGVIFHGAKEWCKIWRKDLLFEKWYGKFGKLSPEHYMSLKFAEDLFHDNEEWCKIWRGIDLSFQNWHEEFEEFWLEHSKI